MMQRITAVVGVSGVGKTFALQSLRERRSFQHLSASQLIREARDLPASTQALESLRSANIDENQKLLAMGFQRARDRKAPHIIIDAHTVIETASGLITLGSDIFEALEISNMLFLAASPERILERRAADRARTRPQVTVEIVRQVQEVALVSAFNICLNLQIPLVVVNSQSSENLEQGLFSSRQD